MLFDNIKMEKQKRILSAAFTSFGKNGYEKTSIADIAKGARVSKASIFQYFNTKKELYLYLVKRLYEVLVINIPKGLTDFFEIMLYSIQLKAKILLENPGIYQFSISLLKEESIQIKDDLKYITNDELNKGIDVLFKEINWNKFKDYLTKEQIYKITSWVSTGYLSEAIEYKEFNEIRNEIKQYLDLLKKLLYKEEYLKETL